MQDKIIRLPSKERTESGQTPLNNLPAQLTRLIGREQETQVACALLRQAGVRLLTLTGPGGVGKTRLGLQVATDLLEDFADGVFFVSLAPISDPAQVIPTIAQTVALRETRDQRPLELLKTYLGEKRVLLFLDNFEQVIEAGPLLVELLQACPDLTVVVTSRAVLHVSGEHEFPVPPLALPDLKQLPESEVLAQYPAVALFLQRARAIKLDFQLTKVNAHAIAEICTRLDGLPLAIELAAARIKLLPPQALLARLDQRLQVLTSGTKDVPTRQQTLHNTIEWSYNLLDATEQRLFRRLSVFVGGCTLEGVEAVCATFDNEVELVLDSVASLVDKSLLQQREGEEGEFRLVMLETIREYALETLAASGKGEATRQAHAMYYLRLAEQAAPELFGTEGQRWFARVEQEDENLKAALHWLLERKEAEQALRLCAALSEFWYVQGYWSEGRTLLEQAFTASGEVAISVRAAALNGLGGLLLLQWNHEQAERRLEESLALYRELGDTGNIGKPLQLLGLLALDQGAYARARLLLEESLIRCREAGDKVHCAFILCNLAGLYQERAEYSTARSCAEESLTLFRELQDDFGIYHALLALAEVLFASQGDTAAVDALLEESRTHLSKSGTHEMWLAEANHLAARVALSQSNIEKARSILKEWLSFYKAKGYQQDTAEALIILGHIATAEGDDVAAQACYEESLVIAREIGYKLVIPANLEGLADVAATKGAYVRAARLWGAAETQRKAMGTPIPPVYRVDYERSVAVTRAQLGERLFATAWAQGRTMTPEQAIAVQEPAAVPEEHSVGPAPIPLVKTPAYPDGLTAREVEVLRLVAQGLTDAQVAEQLVISRRTVNTHLTSIYSKLGIASRNVATRYAMEHHLV